ncbi:Anti-sigma-E factor ChrR [Pseudovibrio axinellae]|uniref:Anti-sigma-E factor ChrR n=1 Tax=Pseudovibrio axinellae TaxID=989403 RepID=A0A165XSS7_9HYPH|nr:ChrR family anti-sigma-E factor [Pseudovibrio axinellae]KZL18002.1 Anti-sigma-E factor ChrR [Pseudovibrio axinellae]SER13900.1 anti-ECFsigma factor, ChrR [Pseudovibrio axinellae]
MINHHLSDETLWAYVTGSLPAGHALLVSCHLELCKACQGRLAEAEALAGALLQTSEQLNTSDELFERLLLRVESEKPSRSLSCISRPKPRQGVPSDLWGVLGQGYSGIKWKVVGPGIRQFVLPVESSEGEKARLLKLSPGYMTPEHSHHGSEMTLVLKGSFSDETGRYKVGDVQEADDLVHHQPVADTEEDCICLAVTDAPLAFKGLLPKLLQPFFGI